METFAPMVVAQDVVETTVLPPPSSYWSDAWMRLRQRRSAFAALLFLLFLAVAAAIGPVLLQSRYDEQETWNVLAHPSSGEKIAIIANEVATGATAQGPLQIAGQATTSGVHLVWGSEGEQFKVYRSNQEGTLGLPLAQISKKEFIDSSNLKAGDTYYYTVKGAREESIKVVPIRALKIQDALKIDPHAQVGQVLTMKPHWLGTDYLGRDLLARLLMGARISLLIGLIAPLLYVFFGALYGAVSGFFGGFIDNAMMRFADLVTTVPEILIVIMLQVTLGSGPVTLVVAMVLSLWTRSAQQIRGEVLRLKSAEFIDAARLAGLSSGRIVLRHILPNVTGSLVVLFTLAIPQAIFTEAFLSFIGLGIAPPLPSWGTLAREGGKFLTTEPLQLIFPTLIISLSMFAFNILGDAVRDALDPKLRGVR